MWRAIGVIITLLPLIILGIFAWNLWMDTEEWLDSVVVMPRDGPKDVSRSVSNELKTFWHIAREYYPDANDLSKVVKEIEKANPHLDPNRLQVGQNVILPRISSSDT